VITEDAESAKRKRPAVARRDVGESRARPAVLAIASDMAAAQACRLEVSTEGNKRLCGGGVHEA
jgi:hypothetical protein